MTTKVTFMQCADELLAALDVIYPGWRESGNVILPESDVSAPKPDSE